MTDATRNQLEQAYRLIQQDELDQAIAILKPVVAAQPDNLDAWWLMANAVSEPEDARRALDNVLRLDPNHWQARDLLNKLNDQFPDLGGAPAAPPLPADTSLDDLFSTPAQPVSDSAISSDELDRLLAGETAGPGGASSFDSGFSTEASQEDLDSLFASGTEAGTDLFSEPFGSAEPGFVEKMDAAVEQRAKPRREQAAPKERKEKKQKPRRLAKEEEPVTPAMEALEAERRVNSRPNPVVLVALLLLIVIVIGGGVTLVLLPNLTGGNRTQQAPTSVSLAGTTPATSATGGASPTAAATTPGAGDRTSALQATNDLFAANQFKDAKASIAQSSLGDTLQVQACSVAGPALQDEVYKAMDMIATEAAKLQGNVKAAGVQFVDCSNPAVTLYRAVAPIDAVLSYVQSGLADKRDYRSTWKHS